MSYGKLAEQGRLVYAPAGDLAEDAFINLLPRRCQPVYTTVE